MKLEVKNIGNKYAMLKVIANKHYCTVSTIANDTAIITKHKDLTKSEFGLVASDLVIEGFQVSLTNEVAELEKNLTENKEILQHLLSNNSEFGEQISALEDYYKDKDVSVFESDDYEIATDNYNDNHMAINDLREEIAIMEFKLKQLKANNA